MQEENQTKFYQDKLNMESPAVQVGCEIMSALKLTNGNHARQVSEIITIARRIGRGEDERIVSSDIVQKFCRMPSDDILRNVMRLVKENRAIFLSE